MVICQRRGLYVNLPVAQVAATPGIMSSSNSHSLKICAPIKKNEKIWSRATKIILDLENKLYYMGNV